ncbi:MAG: type II toxin-antitoxin system RelE/ParE family toxin [Roseburia sp.]
MADTEYTLRYLPLFFDELGAKVDYITKVLQNPQAANDLIDAVEWAIKERLPYAESFEIYRSKKDRKYPYYRIYVGNYTVYYVVIDDESAGKVMEVRRFLYNGQNSEKTV